MLSRNLEKSLHRALACANERRHEYATLEHLLLSLTEDQDAAAVFRACGVDLERLRREVLNYVDNELGNLVASHNEDAKPTANFQRVLQRAAIHVQSSGREEVTGANVLVAMFAERESHAVYFLQEQDITRFDAVNYVSHGIAKAPGRSETRREQKPRDVLRGLQNHLRPPFPGGRGAQLDEIKIIAAILCTRMTLPDDAAIDPIGNTVDLYERILAELRARGPGGPVGKPPEIKDEVWTVDVIELIPIPRPAGAGLVTANFRIGGTFASYQIKGVSLIDVAAIAQKQMDQIIANGEPGDAVQVVDQNGVVRYTCFRRG